MNKRLVLALVVLAMTFGAISASADSIEFSSKGGSYTFAGTTGSTLGTVAPGSGNVEVWQTAPLDNSATPNALTGSYLNFTSGAYLGGGNFGSGGSIYITDTTGSLCGGNCFLGSFTSGQLLLGNTVFTGAFVAGTVDPAVWALVGLPTSPAGATGGITVTLATFAAGRGGTIGSSDFTLTRVPEPASLVLLGTAFLLGGATLRRKFAL